ncbi:MAG: toll/interleukin-1 receptor domain-containing protein, partial [Thermodesulfobacteriota bacterium]
MHAEAKKVFFSYSRDDAEFVLKLATDLRSAGVDLWIDQLDIPAGAEWDRSVEDALKACPCFLVVLSSTSVASQNVMDEASFAIEQDKMILPELYQDCDIPFRLKRLQYIDFCGDYDTAYTKLLSALRRHFPEDAREAPSTQPGSAGTSLDSASVGGDRIEETTERTTRKKSGKSWWRHPASIGGIAVIIAAVLVSLYLYGLFTPGNNLPPIQAPELERELLKANIILSESENTVSQVRSWLTSDPAYQALARSCLKALEGKRVIDPVPLDVINGWYMEALG